MNQEHQFKENVDAWIKDMNRRISELEVLPEIIKENEDNTQHNYELIYELKDELEELEQMIKMMWIQIKILTKQEQVKQWQKAEQEKKNNCTSNKQSLLKT